MNEPNCSGLVRTENCSSQKLICGAIKTSSHFLNMTKKLNDSFKKDLESLSLNDKEKEPGDKIDRLTDKIIRLFTVPERKALIDQSDGEDLVDYDTSVRRLYGFSIIFAFLLALIATTFSIILSHENSSVTIYNPLKLEDSQSIPHLVLLFNDGSMEVYKFSSSNTKLTHSWTFKVPHYRH